MNNLIGEQKYKIGTIFKTKGKHPRVCTVINIFKTYNIQNELVCIRYVATHEFCGQNIIDYDIPQSTIDIGLIEAVV